MTASCAGTNGQLAGNHQAGARRQSSIRATSAHERPAQPAVKPTSETCTNAPAAAQDPAFAIECSGQPYFGSSPDLMAITMKVCGKTAHADAGEAND